MKVSLISLVLALVAAPAVAGVMELGASGNYRISRLNDDNYNEMVSYTGTISYYFWEMSALEMSYTQGTQVSVLKIPNDNKTTITTNFQMVGLDLVITLAAKDSLLQPYIKGGGAYIKKDMVREIETLGRDKLLTSEGLVPSAGAGFKFRLTNAMSFKAGVDAWTSPPSQEKTTIDYAGRAGISWMF